MQDLLDDMNSTKKQVLRFRWWVPLIWLFFFAIGYLFRVMHWPFAGVIRVITAGGFMAYSFNMLILSKERSVLTITGTAVSSFWIVLCIWGVFFNGGYPYNAAGIRAQSISFIILFVIHLGILLLIKWYRKKKQAS